MEQFITISGSSLVGAILSFVLYYLKNKKDKEKEEKTQIKELATIEAEIENLKSGLQKVSEILTNHNHQKYEDDIKALRNDFHEVKETLKGVNTLLSDVGIIKLFMQELKDTNLRISGIITSNKEDLIAVMKDVEHLKELR
jgi:vacuolar-type H+-ATPase subunit I/STV1